MILRVLLTVCVVFSLLTGCGRPLTEAEITFTRTLLGDQIDTKKVRITNGALIGDITRKRLARPQIACRERIWPAPKSKIVNTSTSAFVVHNKVFVSRYFYLDDFMAGYPEKLPLAQAMLLAHEMTHVWQWQNRDITGYRPLRAASEHEPGTDPYLFELGTKRRFLAYPFEQQAAIVEEYVCCRTLDPNGARTNRLAQLLQAVLPPETGKGKKPNSQVVLPWREAQIKGICS
ncbi:MAG: hypothetical protein GY945_02360 [Rhodobacteraceae bacterium]|nr:hypothetical protein [Paracoccaceae bacterium]